MTKRQRAYRQSLIRSIHTSPLWHEVYGNDRELYETMLFNTFRVKSSKELSIEELKSLDDFMHRRTDRVAPGGVYASKQQISFIQTLWFEKATFKLGFNLLKFASRVLKRDVRDLTKITKKEASRLIAGIKALKPLQAVNNV
ncbi:phage protein GemA/Gp16 family protein [Hydrogenimonas thermophila]|uniref:Uncharacterized protein n=1 Tax=Hydrogenimonas thermophila TaxID=223786 RepID=A0A1I5RS69_9BACT|nr:phage protein GemA/Gp16 family protein [Hydrogenimonas thermophila]SFP61365.1 Protein of unknown function [Hydrogenimonas thermophila]